MLQMPVIGPLAVTAHVYVFFSSMHNALMWETCRSGSPADVMTVKMKGSIRGVWCIMQMPRLWECGHHSGTTAVNGFL